MTWIEIHREAIGQLLKSPAVLADLKRRAEAIAAAAGEGYEAEAEVQKHRARAAVHTTTFDSVKDNFDNNTLIQSIDSGR